MKRYNYVIIGLGIIILIILSTLVYIETTDEKIMLILYGERNISLYEGESYNEFGYVAINDSGENVSNRVLVNSDIDINKAGNYTVKYTIKTRFKRYIRDRSIKVLDDPLNYIHFALKGNATVNIQLGEEYHDLRFVCTKRDNNEDLSRYVSIENGVNNQKEGVYDIVYRLVFDGKEKTLTRKVYVLKQKNTYSLSTTNLTNKPVTMTFKSYIHDFAYVVCPNKTFVYKNQFTYNFFLNGEYTFYIYDTSKNYTEYVIKINNIDMTPPSGNCSVTLKNGITTYNVKTNDNDISKYVYDDDDNYSSDKNYFTINRYLRNNSVRLVDKANNKTVIKCSANYQYKPPITPNNNENVKYSATSSSLIVNSSYDNGYYITRIWAKDPYMQMRKEMLDSNQRSLLKPSVILKKAIDKYKLENKIVLASNASGVVLKGSYYSYIAENNNIYNLKEPSPLLVYNGEIIINDYKNYSANGVVYYINSSNKLSYIPIMEKNSVEERYQAFSEALDSGILNTFAFNAILVIDGVIQPTNSDYYALRQGFCQVDENNFILVTSDTRRWNKPDFPKVLADLGCQTAVNFDGGGSVALMFKPKNQKNVDILTGDERALSSVMYFTELES